MVGMSDEIERLLAELELSLPESKQAKRETLFSAWFGMQRYPSEESRCATSLWRLTQWVLSGEAAESHRARLSRLLDEAFDQDRPRTLLADDSEWIPHLRALSGESILRVEARMVAHFSLAKCALLTQSADTYPAPIKQEICELVDAALILLTEASVNDSRKWDQPPVPEFEFDKSPFRIVLDRLADWLGANKSSPEKPILVSAIVQVEMALNWLLSGIDKTAPSPNPPTRSLLIPLVQESETEDGQNEPRYAFARLETWEHFSNVPGINGQPALVPDTVSQGMMLYGSSLDQDDLWHKHLDHARQWAVETSVAGDSKNRQAGVFTYSVKILDQTESPKLPVVVGGPSASLGMGMLLRSHLEGTTIPSKDFVTGGIEKTRDGFGFKTVGGFEVKKPAIEQFRKQAKFVYGPLDHDGQRFCQSIKDFGVDDSGYAPETTLEGCYQKVTQLAKAIEKYAQSVFHSIAIEIREFLPERTDRILIDNAELEQKLAALDEINFEQYLLPADYKRTEESEPSHNLSQKTWPLDSAIDTLLKSAKSEIPTDSPSSSGTTCFKLLGAPGMGKTFAGLRTQARILHNLAADPSCPWFPIRITAKRLESLFFESEKDIDQIVIDQVLSKISDKDLQQTLKAHLVQQLASDQPSIVLIVDAWDERKHSTDGDRQWATGRSEEDLISALQRWMHRQRLIITCREGVPGLHRVSDPLQVIDRSSPPWCLVHEEQANGFEAFARGWFGEEFDDYREQVAYLNGGRFKSFTTNPQLATICCWAIKHRSMQQPTFTNEAELFATAIDVILNRFETKNANPFLVKAWTELDWKELLSKLAFETFDGSRWAFGSTSLLTKKLNELRAGNYCDLVTNKELATELAKSGLFNLVDEEVSIIHQRFAEYFVALELQTRFPSVIAEATNESEYHEILVRYGLLDEKWKQTWLLYADLCDKEQLTQFVAFLAEQSLACDSLLPYHAGNFLDYLIVEVVAKNKICKCNDSISKWIDGLKSHAQTRFDWLLVMFDKQYFDRCLIHLAEAGYGSQLKSANEEHPSYEVGFYSDTVKFLQLIGGHIEFDDVWDNHIRPIMEKPLSWEIPPFICGGVFERIPVERLAKHLGKPTNLTNHQIGWICDLMIREKATPTGLFESFLNEYLKRITSTDWTPDLTGIHAIWCGTKHAVFNHDSGLIGRLTQWVSIHWGTLDRSVSTWNQNPGIHPGLIKTWVNEKLLDIEVNVGGNTTSRIFASIRESAEIPATESTVSQSGSFYSSSATREPPLFKSFFKPYDESDFVMKEWAKLCLSANSLVQRHQWYCEFNQFYTSLVDRWFDYLMNVEDGKMLTEYAMGIGLDEPPDRAWTQDILDTRSQMLCELHEYRKNTPQPELFCHSILASTSNEDVTSFLQRSLTHHLGEVTSAFYWAMKRCQIQMDIGVFDVFYDRFSDLWDIGLHESDWIAINKRTVAKRHELPLSSNQIQPLIERADTSQLDSDPELIELVKKYKQQYQED